MTAAPHGATTRTRPAPHEEPAPQVEGDRPHHRTADEPRARAELADPLRILRLVLVELDQLARRLDDLEQRFADRTGP